MSDPKQDALREFKEALVDLARPQIQNIWALYLGALDCDERYLNHAEVQVSFDLVNTKLTIEITGLPAAIGDAE